MNERLRELRKKLGLTLKDFGKRLGVSDAAISRIENGERKLTEQMILSVCREFNVNEDWIRFGKGPMHKDSDEELGSIYAQLDLRDETAKDALRKYMQLSEEDKELFWKFVKRFIK